VTTVISFDDALKARPDVAKRLVLLGNGFSVACRPAIFQYGEIYKGFVTNLSVSDRPRIKTVFESLGSREFEDVIREWELGDEIKAKVHYLHGALHLFSAGHCGRLECGRGVEP
jgi:hypothetical protein